jgi:hypothetical protein
MLMFFCEAKNKLFLFFLRCGHRPFAILAFVRKGEDQKPGKSRQLVGIGVNFSYQNSSRQKDF